MSSGIQYLLLLCALSALVSGQVCVENSFKSTVNATYAVELHLITFDSAISTGYKDAIQKMFKLENATESNENLDRLIEIYHKVRTTVKSAKFIKENEIEATVILSKDSGPNTKMAMFLEKCPKSPSGWQVVKVGSSGSVQRKIPYLSCIFGVIACLIEVYVRAANGY